MGLTSNAAMDSASAASDVNDIVWIIVGSVGALVAIGVSIDVALRSSRAFGRKRPVFIPVRVLTLLLCSYGCLLPGLVLNLFSAGVVLNLFGVKMVDLSESMIALVQRMFDHRMYAGAILVAVYALVIPAVKLVLIVLSMVFQRGGKPRLHHARRCIAIVRLVSKWASPDMFAYILMTTLFRSLNKPPKLTSEVALDERERADSSARALGKERESQRAKRTSGQTHASATPPSSIPSPVAKHVLQQGIRGVRRTFAEAHSGLMAHASVSCLGEVEERLRRDTA